MNGEKKKNVIVAYSGDFMNMTILDYDSPFPALRIEGVFSKKKHFERFAEEFHLAHEHTILYKMKLPLNPEYGEKEEGMKPYFVKTNTDFEVIKVKKIKNLAENDPRFSGDMVQAIETGSEEYTVTCWARDKFDACKRAIAELRESTTEFDFDHEEDESDVVAKVIIHFPTDPTVSCECPLMFEMPEVGEILNIPFEKIISESEEWDLVQRTLVNGVMVVDRIEGDQIYLRKGNPLQDF